MPYPTIPEKVWGSAQKPGMTSQVGCVQCLSEGTHAPVDIVYYWSGTSMCFTHIQDALERQKGSNAQ